MEQPVSEPVAVQCRPGTPGAHPLSRADLRASDSRRAVSGTMASAMHRAGTTLRMASWTCVAILATPAAGFFTSAVAAQPGEPPLPEFDGFVAEVKTRLQFDQKLLNQYTYQQRTVLKHLDKHDRVKKVETKLYEVFPDSDQQLRYRRLIEKDGKAVSAAERSKQDRKYRKRRADSEKRHRKSDPDAEEKARAEEREAIEEAFRAFDFAMEGRETVNGRPAIRFSFEPKPGVSAKSREVKILRNFAGRVWFDEESHELVRLEVTAIRDVRIGWGMVAKLRQGASASLERRLFNNEVWLPSMSRFSGNLRLLLVKGMRMEATDEFFDYRAFRVETAVSFGQE